MRRKPNLLSGGIFNEAIATPVPAIASSGPTLDPALDAALRQALVVERRQIVTARVSSENGSAAPESQALDNLLAKINEIVQPLLELRDGQKVKVIANIHLRPDSAGNWQRGQVTFRVEKAEGSRAVDPDILNRLAAALNHADLVIPINAADEQELFMEPGLGLQTGILYNFIYE